MIICILEYPEDEQPQVWFMDTTKLDLTNPAHIAYKAAVDEALLDSMEVSILPGYNQSYFFGDEMEVCAVWPSCKVDRQITIYLE